MTNTNDVRSWNVWKTANNLWIWCLKGHGLKSFPWRPHCKPKTIKEGAIVSQWTTPKHVKVKQHQTLTGRVKQDHHHRHKEKNHQRQEEEEYHHHQFLTNTKCYGRAGKTFCREAPVGGVVCENAMINVWHEGCAVWDVILVEVILYMVWRNTSINPWGLAAFSLLSLDSKSTKKNVRLILWLHKQIRWTAKLLTRTARKTQCERSCWLPTVWINHGPPPQSIWKLYYYYTQFDLQLVG